MGKGPGRKELTHLGIRKNPQSLEFGQERVKWNGTAGKVRGQTMYELWSLLGVSTLF